MKRIAAAFVLTLCSLAYAQGAMTVSDLRCEYLTNPIGIDVKSPRLTWLLNSNQRGAAQSAYQILVASSAENLAKDQGDLWDSGKVPSDDTTHIAYAGKPLSSGQLAYWKLRVWDQNGQSSPYSDPASFEMGLLNSADWKAQWIAAPQAERPTTYPAGKSFFKDASPSPLLRKGFSISKQVKSARAYICGLGYYELYLNGKKVGDHVLDPVYTQYNKRILYVTYDITAQLQQGKNAVGVMLADGFYNQWVPDVWNFHKAPWRARPKLLMQLNIEYADDSHESIVSDPTWKCADGPIRYTTTRAGEFYDARDEKPGWNTPDFDDASWATAIAANAPQAVLSAQMCPPMRVKQTLKPASVKEVSPGVFVYDIGQNMVGWIRLSLSGPAGTAVTMRFGERLKPDGSLDMSNIDPYFDKSLFQKDVYILKGSGIETYEPRFTYHGFQYVEITGFPGKLTLDNLQARIVHTDFPQVGEFACSNDIINKLQRATLWSYIGNFQAIPTDCPHREKNGWTGDAHLAAELAMYNFDNAAAYSTWIQSVADAQFANGFIPDIVPDPKWTLNAGPAWESVVILIPWYMYQYNGDTRILEQHYPTMVKLMDRFAKLAKNNLLHYGLNDWVALKPTPAEYTINSYYYLDAQIMAKVAAMLNKPDDASKYSNLAADIRKAYNDELFDKAAGRYKADTQTAQLTPLYQGIANDDDRQRVFDTFMKLLADNKNHPNTGVFGAHYMPRILSDFGQIDRAITLLTQSTGPGWGEWIARGYTTLQENWGRGDSQNHIFFGHISTWFYNTLAGIRLDPAKPAWKHILIHPVIPSQLEWAKAQTKTIRGTIASSWKKSADGLALDVTIPPNTTATVYVPAAENAKLTESGKPAAESAGVKPMGWKSGYAIFEIGSGTYQFVAK